MHTEPQLNGNTFINITWLQQVVSMSLCLQKLITKFN